MAVQLKTLAEVTLNVANQRKQLTTEHIMVYSASLQGADANTGAQYFGDASVSTSNGFKFAQADVVEIEGPPSLKGGEMFDLSEVYVVSDTAGVKLRVVAWIRK